MSTTLENTGINVFAEIGEIAATLSQSQNLRVAAGVRFAQLSEAVHTPGNNAAQQLIEHGYEPSARGLWAALIADPSFPTKLGKSFSTAKKLLAIGRADDPMAEGQRRNKIDAERMRVNRTDTKGTDGSDHFVTDAPSQDEGPSSGSPDERGGDEEVDFIAEADADEAVAERIVQILRKASKSADHMAAILAKAYDRLSEEEQEVFRDYAILYNEADTDQEVIGRLNGIECDNNELDEFREYFRLDGVASAARRQALKALHPDTHASANAAECDSLKKRSQRCNAFFDRYTHVEQEFRDEPAAA